MSDSSVASLFSKVRAAEPWLLDTANLKKGIDNYHADIRISARFNSDLIKLVATLLDQATSPPSKPIDNSREFETLQSTYQDLMTVLIHRVKTDLRAEEIQLLEFAITKHVLETVRSQLDEMIAAIKVKVTEYQARGSTQTLTANHRMVSLQRNYDSVQFRVNRQIFTQLQRAEARQLRTLREQYLPALTYQAVDVLTNPMLYISNPGAIPFLLEQYRIWTSEPGNDSDDAGFTALNSTLETLLSRDLPEYSMLPMLVEQPKTDPELYDTLGGLLQTQRFMGIAGNQGNQLLEEFCWFDDPVLVKELFDTERFPAMLAAARRDNGFKAWWKLRQQTRRISRTLDRIATQLHKHNRFRSLIASRLISSELPETLTEQFDVKTLCQFMSGQLTLKKLLEKTGTKKPLPESVTLQLEKYAGDVRKIASASSRQNAAAILMDVSRFRVNLKYYRFAHRAFNRFNILKSPEDINLSRQAGTLYTLLTSHEREDSDMTIVHHAVMKADVRGSTTVTDELQNRDLNPASYFSLRFFSPINKILATYGAEKVFIEGDAVILSFLEHEQEPQQWFSVARSCGLAKAMLSIVHANNRYSHQMGLPPLELGIGICYLDKAPRYLYDEDRPIMISSAIGLADRMSSCSWKLREHLQPGLFNVDVFQYSDGEPGKGEKGQQVIRYNVNGILLDDIAFAKLHTEITLKQLSVKINKEQVILHAGKYPDKEGKSHDLLIREGRVGLWRDNAPVAEARSEQRYYEVLSNRKMISEILSRL